MKDDYYNNKFSQKMLPLIDIFAQNIVLFIFYIFMGVAFDFLKF